jgi:redox-sensitive bicupin YhaK (pirin superfamily)
MSRGAASDNETPRLRPAGDRGRVAAGTSGEGGIVATEAFSRGEAIDRGWMGWGALRVLSRQDWAPGATRHDRVANMERLLLVLEGVLDVDCCGFGRHRVTAGGVLWIGAGHGIDARMANAADAAPLRLVECWLQPDRVNAPPSVALRPADVDMDGETGGGGVSFAAAWATLAGPGGTDAAGALPLRQRARVMGARIGAGARLALPSTDAPRCWLEVLEGDVIAMPVNPPDGVGGGDAGPRLVAGDGLGWLADDAGAPASVVVAGAAPAWLLFLALPA